MKSKTINDKKGDISITILVLGVFLICAFAILSFYLSEKNIQRVIGIGLIEEMNTEIEKYNFYKNNFPEFSENEILEILSETVNVKTDETGASYFYLEKYSKKGSLSFGKQEKVMSVRYYLP